MARLFAACVHNHGPNHSSVMADPNIPYSPSPSHIIENILFYVLFYNQDNNLCGILAFDFAI